MRLAAHGQALPYHDKDAVGNVAELVSKPPQRIESMTYGFAPCFINTDAKIQVPGKFNHGGARCGPKYEALKNSGGQRDGPLASEDGLGVAAPAEETVFELAEDLLPIPECDADLMEDLPPTDHRDQCDGLEEGLGGQQGHGVGTSLGGGIVWKEGTGMGTRLEEVGAESEGVRVGAMLEEGVRGRGCAGAGITQEVQGIGVGVGSGGQEGIGMRTGLGEGGSGPEEVGVGSVLEEGGRGGECPGMGTSLEVGVGVGKGGQESAGMRTGLGEGGTGPEEVGVGSVLEEGGRGGECPGMGTSLEVGVGVGMGGQESAGMRTGLGEGVGVPEGNVVAGTALEEGDGVEGLLQEPPTDEGVWLHELEEGCPQARYVERVATHLSPRLNV
ncbi:unnamed protein product [Closterium sp. NIES-65]|nr:unnamed protein product [Closterium sp. NIES-65]